ncbi:hypothetical protein EYF80_010970 [Liparis tanakae]|uniref:Uncharacterized protein n=1 Tax=Liparis tanakae TaxID=230148 RepID=A0A4Z2IL71_9TELE|nr:hypothetical protein EYF80_010970 [Liparis tanakae]
MNSLLMASDREKSRWSEDSRGMAELLRSRWVLVAYTVGAEESPALSSQQHRKQCGREERVTAQLCCPAPPITTTESQPVSSTAAPTAVGSGGRKNKTHRGEGTGVSFFLSKANHTAGEIITQHVRQDEKKKNQIRLNISRARIWKSFQCSLKRKDALLCRSVKLALSSSSSSMADIFCSDSIISKASDWLSSPSAGPVRLSRRVITDRKDMKALHDEPNADATCVEILGRLLDFSRTSATSDDLAEEWELSLLAPADAVFLGLGIGLLLLLLRLTMQYPSVFSPSAVLSL